MSSYLPESRVVESGGTVYSSSLYAPAQKNKAGRGLLDSFDYTQSSYAEAKQKTVQAEVEKGRAELPKPQKSASQDDLMILAEAFCSAFNAMDKGIRTQTSDYAQLQELDETQAQIVLQSTKNAVAKEVKAEKLAAKVASYEKSMAEDNEIFGWVMFGVGIAITVAIFASAFFDFGASLAAAPEAVEMVELAPEAVEGAQELEEVGDLSSNLEDLDNVGEESDLSGEEDSTQASMREMQETMDRSSTNINFEENPEQIVDDLLKSDTENAKSASRLSVRLAKFAGKFGLKLTIGAVMASPMLMRGITGLKVADKLDDVAHAQKTVGNALALLQSNNMYFQFLQKFVQREGSVLQEEANDASEIIDTYASITSAYRGISYGLANAV